MQGLILLGPAMVVYGVFAVLPTLDVFRLSVMRWDGLAPSATFVGFDNYRAILSDDPVFWLAFGNTLIWTALSVVFPPAIGFALALGLNQQIIGRNILRAVFYMPVIIASIAVATMWRWMYDPFFGVVNAVLTAVGLDGLIQDWLGDRSVALYAVFVAYAWQNVGVSMVLFLAGLQTVSPTLVEAARMDGAKRVQIFRHVTLPALRSTITVVLILTLINSLKAFDIVYGMTHGGPAQSTQLMAFWAFWQSLQLHDFGRGSAIAVILLLMTVVVVIPYLHWAQKREDAAQ
ncbi:carbohydrate ABC transporter permease [Lichenihabitans psoromatis]|uniref:carbohydrate ABC transporter permease n=1 Tax=Lichenihabitans psoromatis TaxID=2528642 RepID=UPI0010385902|nr:sugar ABC transporter permease [Lichenihabitans psoromatis]